MVHDHARTQFVSYRIFSAASFSLSKTLFRKIALLATSLVSGESTDLHTNRVPFRSVSFRWPISQQIQVLELTLNIAKHFLDIGRRTGLVTQTAGPFRELPKLLFAAARFCGPPLRLPRRSGHRCREPV